MALSLVPSFHPYTELKSASYFSFLKGGSSPQEMLETAVALGLRALAITDLGGVYGIPRAYHALQRLRKENKAPKDFKLLVGAEIILTDAHLPSIVLLAPHRKAYGGMCRMLTHSHAGRPKGTGDLSLESLLQYLQTIPGASDLILFPQWEEYWLHNQENFLDQPILEDFKKLKTLPNPIYLPLARYQDGLDQERTACERELSRRFQIPCVAHQNALFHERKQQIVQDVLTSIREGAPIQELGLKLKRNAERYLKGAEQMGDLFSDFPEAIQATEEIYQRCNFEMSELRYQYPTEWIPKEHSAQSYLEFLCEEGMKERYPHGPSFEVIRVLRQELKLVKELNFADYFLTVYDIVAFARSRKILCQGRGSAANSVVCYLLGITAIDPVRMELLFERFLSVERGEPPDIDVDFEHDRREEVIQYIYSKYGRDRAAMVSAVVTYRERSSLREVAKAFSVPVGTASAREVRKMMLASKDISEQKKLKIAEVIEKIEGYPRHLSIHSGGFTLSHEPIDTIVPIEPATMEGRTIVQWDKYDLDILGLLKIDVLSLGMLSALRRTLDSVGMKLYEVPHDDEPTYRMMCRADTIGVFQIESRAQMAMLPRLKPRNFYDLVVELALVRPGPIVGNMVHPYLKRRNGTEPVTYPHPAIEKILKRTYGVPIFQEQVMKIAIEVGGFSPGEADQLRRAIGAWRSSGSIDVMGRRLMQGLTENGVSPQFSEQIFNQIQGFSEYGFPESHSASFALLTYASVYLKCHHPAAFLCALLNSQPMGFYSPHSLIDDAKRHGVKVLPIDINHSIQECELTSKNVVRIGFNYIRVLKDEEVARICKERAKSPFQSFQDFRVRTEISNQGLRALALASAFESVGLNSRESLFELLSMQEGLFAQVEIQEDLFSKVHLPELTPAEKVTQDYAATGFSVRGHPVKFLRDYLRVNPLYQKDRKWIGYDSKTIRSISRNGQMIRFIGLSVVLQRPPTAKGTAFATLEDESGVIDLIFHQKTFETYKEWVREEAFLWVIGQVQRDGDAIQVIVKKIEKIFKENVVLQDLRLPHAPGAHAM